MSGPRLTRRGEAVQRAAAEQQRQAARVGWLTGFCVGILSGVGVLLWAPIARTAKGGAS